jgi:hypothetical protein
MLGVVWLPLAGLRPATQGQRGQPAKPFLKETNAGESWVMKHLCEWKLGLPSVGVRQIGASQREPQPA